MPYYDDYETEPIGGGNPYSRCVHCKRSTVEINGELEGHSEYCRYRQGKTPELKQRAVQQAAVEWWEGKRPVGWDLLTHLASPAVNTATAAEERLARAVAEAVALNVKA
jgi:hypothetical protein